MSKKAFTEKEIKILSQNKYVNSVTSKKITYTNEFKLLLIAAHDNDKTTKQIFQECGFDVETLGMIRIKAAGKRWRRTFKEEGVLGLDNRRKSGNKKTVNKSLTLKEQNSRLEAQVKLLKAENELFKKNRAVGKGVENKEITLRAADKFLLIKETIKSYKLKNMVSYLCESVGVSRSGYYNYFSAKSIQKRKERENDDKISRDDILKAYKFKGRKKGARQIKMTLEGQFNTIYNLKRIRRIMKKFNIICPIRKANPYRKIIKATMEHLTLPNLLNRNFKQNIPGKVLLTDITYLFYGNGKKAYLSTIKDGSTNEILAYNMSTSLTIDLVTNTVKKLIKSKTRLAEGALIHSDQGVHYTSPIFQKLVKSYGLQQSMSRRGNCWDNAPQESFFGHFKDEAYIKQCNTLKELEQEIHQYMVYYNKFRYQWNLRKMTPVEYRNHLNEVA